MLSVTSPVRSETSRLVETAAWAGMQDFGLGVLPDRSPSFSRDGRTTLRLGFDM
jgi:hypothetical protein